MEGLVPSLAGGLLALATLAGHGCLCAGVINRVHALGLPRWLLKLISAGWYCWFVAAAAAGVYWFGRLGLDSFRAAVWHLDPAGPSVAFAYVALTWVALAVTAVRWLALRWAQRRRAPARTLAVERHNLARRASGPPLAGAWPKLAHYWPANQLLEVELLHEQVEVPGLPLELDRLSILHLSDFHISGRLTLDYFGELVRLVAPLEPDLVLLSGDICDRRQLIGWAPKILERVRGRYGQFFVLGNHDLRTQALPQLRAAVEQAGFVDLGGKGRAIEIAGQTIWLDGDERPWLVRPKTAALNGNQTSLAADRLPASASHSQSRRTGNIAARPASGASSSLAGNRALDPAHTAALRILLAHTPDRFAAAQQQGFDLMFCGHTHGGQVRLPVIGPVLCPSRYGVRYASGWFSGGPTLMRVSRGSGSLFPIRWGCRADVGLVVLRPAEPRTAEKRAAEKRG